jgi:hypothetical protein
MDSELKVSTFLHTHRERRGKEFRRQWEKGQHAPQRVRRGDSNLKPRL